MAKDTSPISVGSLWEGKTVTSANLGKLIFELSNPEQAVRTLPAQSIYMAAKHQGLAASAELIALVNQQQMQLLLDFDLWQKDELNEESLWEWLEVTDAEGDLALLQKVFKSLDLKLVSILIARYVQVHIPDTPNETPPGPGFYSPDQGQSWLHITIEEGRKHFLLGRLLALVFETSRELYYQLLAIPGVQTPSLLEEEAYQDRCRRLSAEGVPDPAFAAQVNAPLPVKDFLALVDVERENPSAYVTGLSAVAPLCHAGPGLQPLDSFLNELAATDEVAEEVTLLMNAAIVFWNVDFSQQTEVINVVERVRGALNIGLEHALEVTKLPGAKLHEKLGLQPLYRLGLSDLLSLRFLARSIVKQLGEKVSDLKPEDFSLVAQARENFPQLPAFFQAEGSPLLEDGKLQSGSREIRSLREVRAARRALDNLSTAKQA